MADANTWQEVEKKSCVWTFESPSEKFFPMRMVAFRLNDGSIAVYSPVPKPSEKAIQELKNFGNVKVLIAPNYFHNLGIRPFKEIFPEANIFCSEKAKPRLEKVTGFKFDEIQNLQNLLPEYLKVLSPRGLKTGEVWIQIFFKSGIAWIVCDAVFNILKVPKGFFGLILRLGGTAPGFRVSRVFRFIGLKNKLEYREWLQAQVELDQPSLIIPSHGDFLRGDNLGREVLSKL